MPTKELAGAILRYFKVWTDTHVATMVIFLWDSSVLEWRVLVGSPYRSADHY